LNLAYYERRGRLGWPWALRPWVLLNALMPAFALSVIVSARAFQKQFATTFQHWRVLKSSAIAAVRFERIVASVTVPSLRGLKNARVPAVSYDGLCREPDGAVRRLTGPVEAAAICSLTWPLRRLGSSVLRRHALRVVNIR
jgi:hypothetical protein